MAHNGASDVPDGRRDGELRLHLWGWVLFVICAVLFIVSSIRNRDVLSLVASVLFLLGCGVFMIPLLRTIAAGRSDRSPE